MEKIVFSSNNMKNSRKVFVENAQKLILFAGTGKSLALKQVKDRKGFYRKNKQEYANKIIPYTDSPTGKAYVGVAKLPLMANDSGIGFQGVLLQDDNRRFVQCYGCGKWAKKLTHSHIQRCLDMSTFEYKVKFGLNQSQGLVSDETSLLLTKCALQNKNRHHLKTIYGEACNSSRTRRSTTRTRQRENKFGTCPEQIKTRLYDFIRCNRELPSQGNKGRSLYKILCRRFGSFGRGLWKLGLPKLKRVGTNMHYTFPDYTTYSYNINQMYDREALFNMMVQKCAVLTEK